MRIKPNKISLELAEEYYSNEIKNISSLFDNNGINLIKSSPAGSLRRKRKLVGDLDIVIEVDNPQLAGQLLEKNSIYKPCARNAFYRGQIAETGIDLFIAGKYNFYSMLFFLTGSEDWNLKIMRFLKTNTDIRYTPFKFINSKNREVYDFNSEEEIFKLIMHNYVRPEYRSPQNINYGV